MGTDLFLMETIHMHLLQRNFHQMFLKLLFKNKAITEVTTR